MTGVGGGGAGTAGGRGHGFEPATGDGPPVPEEGAALRAAEVRTAHEGLRQIRRVLGAVPDDGPGTTGPGATGPGATGPGATGADGAAAEGRPAPWERERSVRAVALVLEAAGIPPSAVAPDGRRDRTGYVVRAGEGPGRVRVTWEGPAGSRAAEEEAARLADCADVLGRWGWDCLLYRGPRRRRFLEAEPAR
ncbi:hypothetical protein [Streptomyces sp. NPDC093225]|uniref:hypothetical protein n=1 Tax=Streptomyces sp. NPDC093225 TaxID=3366034 RepID=UPI00382689E8